MYQIRSIPINYNRVKLLFELRLKILLKLHEAINKFMSDQCNYFPHIKHLAKYKPCNSSLA